MSSGLLQLEPSGAFAGIVPCAREQDCQGGSILPVPANAFVNRVAGR